MPRNLNKDIYERVNLFLERFLQGEELHLVESGVSVFIDQNRATATKPKTRAVVTMNPTASILIKKKAFSTFKSTNDLRWMDKTEKMLLRATKALFALKVSQVQAYESLTKLDKFYDETGEINFKILADLIQSSKYLNVKNNNNSAILDALISFGASAGVASSLEDIIKLARRTAFSRPNMKTTWIIDPDDVQNYGTGPGTGVIELCTFTSINTNSGISSDSKTASISIMDPYRIMNIIEDDIEMAIEESIYGTLGLLNDLAHGAMGSEYIDPTLIVSSAFEFFGVGKMDSTIDVDYIRDRLRTFYLGKWIANVNDGVHIYIASNKSSTSNSHFDEDSFSTRIDESFFKVDEIMLEAERKLYTNQRISQSLYNEIRTRDNNSFTMQHVFGGYVKGVSETYSPDRSVLSISCQDNMGWLKGVRYMEEPGLMDPRAALEDPITPYDLRNNSSDNRAKSNSLELLPENKTLLSSGLLSFNNGLLTGYNANESNIYQGNYSGPGSAYGSQIVQHPSGLIYRWRSGVLAITSSFSPNAPSGSGIPNSSAQSFRQNYGFSVANGVVANLDVANVISVMVTGQPYNIETFTQLAFDAMNVSRSGNSLNPNEALSFVLDSIRKQNSFYGNFKPFRLITMSEKTINSLASESLSFQDSRSKVAILRKRKNELKRKIRILSNDNGSDFNSGIISLLNQEINSIDLSIQKQIEATYRNNNLNGTNSIGINSSDLLDINFNIFGQNKVLKNDGSTSADHDLNRAMMRLATQRRIEDVKLNRDQNLLIISDQYDLNPEIKANILKLRTSGFKLFSGSYMDVYSRCQEAASVTMMEFFCNTQGHLEIRPPLYNKTPLSVLNGLYNYQKITGRKIVPDFLFTMLTDKISSLKLEIHSLNIRIVILAFLLGKYPDSRLIPGVPAAGTGSLRFFGVSPGISESRADADLSNLSFDPGNEGGLNFNFNNSLTSDSHSNYFYLDLGSKENGDLLLGNIDQQIGNFDEIVREFGTVGEPDYNLEGSSGGNSIYDKVLYSAVTIASITSNTKKVADAKGLETVQSLLGSLGSSTDIIRGINTIRQNFRTESGIDPASGLKSSGNNGDFSEKDLVFYSGLDVNSGAIESRIDEIFSKLNQAISERNSLISILKKNQEKEKELQRIQEDLENGFSENNVDFWEDPDVSERILGTDENPSQKSKFIKDAYLTGRYTKRAIDATRQFLAGGATKGTLFDHLIDDDTRNLLGPGSGRRFVIYDEFIKNYDVREQEPEFTRVDIFGSTPLINDQVKGITGGENLTQWAGAVDYDLWRQYGYKWKPVNDAPFISDAETQAKPLALQHLAVQRAAIFSGTVQVAGNEYYQPGDTVYIPSKGLLFYVHSITHSFSYGSTFDTNLTIVYGHPPGHYLPTPMDVIGQTYSKDSLKHSSYFVQRSMKGDDNYRPLQPDCSLRFPKFPKITEDNKEYLLSHKNNMVKFYNMITDVSNGLLTSNRMLLIRGFIKEDSEADEVSGYMSVVSNLFQNPVMLTQKVSESQDLSTALGDDLLADSLGVTQTLFNINSGSGLNKELSTIFLPNGAPVTKVTKDKILFQLVNLKREESGPINSFKCFSQIALDKLGSVRNENGNLLKTDLSSAESELYNKLGLPKGGPSQSTWLEMEDLIQNISSLITGDYEKIIEIGILDLDDASVKLLMSLK